MMKLCEARRKCELLDHGLAFSELRMGETYGSRNLSSDVAELNDESDNGVLALPQRALIDVSSVGLIVGHVLLRNLRKLGEEEEDHDGSTKAGNTEVDELDTVERALANIAVTEESLTGDQRTDERCETVESLGKVEAEGSLLRSAENGNVTVGANLESGETAGDDESRNDESWEALKLG